MSSILNALKKLEQERHRESRRNSTQPLDAAILHDQQTVERRTPSTGLLLGGALFLFLGGAGLVYLTQRPAPQKSQQANTAITAVLPDRPVPITFPPVQTAPKQPATVPLQQPQARQEKQSAPPLLPAKPITHPTTPQPTRQPPPVQVTTQQAQRPNLKVLGIAYQAGDAASNLAIVNGTPVSAGGMIEGARVEEIQKDRVKFSMGGERFEVMLAR